MNDESLERELFALRAVTIETPRLDLEDVFARADRPWRASHRGSRIAACASMIACAAASYMALAPSQTHAPETSAASATMSYFDGLSCRNDMPDAITTSDPGGMCVAHAQLVCDVTLESSRP